MLYAVRNECERRGKYRGSNDAETYGRQVVDDLKRRIERKDHEISMILFNTIK